MTHELQSKKSFKYFWEVGNGKNFKDWANTTPNFSDYSKYENEFFSYDKRSDEVVLKHLTDKSFHKIMQTLNPNGNTNDLPDDVKEMLSEMQKIPDWVDFKLIQEGAELAQRSGLIGLLVLKNFCLFSGYYFPSLTKSLIATGALEKGSKYRLYNTLSFWVEINRLDEKANEKRLRACLKTRLTHSAARLMIQKNEAKQGVSSTDIPINNMNMVATNLGFTLYYLYGLNALNFNYTKKEELGVYHLWKYICWLFQVPVEYLPNNSQEALDFFYYWTSKQSIPNEGSVKLADSLMKENTPLEIFKLGIINNNLPYILTSVTNYLVDEQTKSALKVPKTKAAFLIPTVLKLRNQLIPLFMDKSTQIRFGIKEIKSVLNDYSKS